MRTTKLIFVSTAFLLLSAILIAQTKPWVIPANFKSMKNAIASSEASNKAGQAIYTKNCASCHGKTGVGDGVKARALKDFPGDFSKAEFQSLTDGDIFYMTKTGRDEMPKYAGKLTDDEIWNTVNYIRTLKK